MDCSMPGFPVHHQLLKLTQPHVHYVGDAIKLPYPLLSPSPPALNLSQHQGLFQWSALCIRWPKYCSFIISISPSNEYSQLISFRIDLYHLLTVQWTFKSLLQHHSLKVSILWCSAFFILSSSHIQHDYWKSHSFHLGTKSQPRLTDWACMQHITLEASGILVIKFWERKHCYIKILHL